MIPVVQNDQISTSAMIAPQAGAMHCAAMPMRQGRIFSCAASELVAGVQDR
jgi:hypothetical protein